MEDKLIVHRYVVTSEKPVIKNGALMVPVRFTWAAGNSDDLTIEAGRVRWPICVGHEYEMRCHYSESGVQVTYKSTNTSPTWIKIGG